MEESSEYLEKYRKYWDTRQTSGHRDGSDRFYFEKACEHVELLTQEERNSGAVDLGTGAGELLYYLKDRMNVNYALDFSSAMLDKAQQKIGTADIKFSNEDIFSFLPLSQQPVWLACGSINQYLASNEQKRFLRMFVDNEYVRTLCYYDTVDPIKYLLRQYGIIDSYIDNPRTNARAVAKNLYGVLKLLNGILFTFKYDKHVPLGRMGFAFSPQYWIDICNQNGLSCQIVSSRYYEYRYHVLIRKPPR